MTDAVDQFGAVGTPVLGSVLVFDSRLRRTRKKLATGGREAKAPRVSKRKAGSVDVAETAAATSRGASGQQVRRTRQPDRPSGATDRPAARDRVSEGSASRPSR